jgi:hypothetical protein
MFGICSWECIKDMNPTSRIGGHLLADSRSLADARRSRPRHLNALICRDGCDLADVR